MSQTRILSIHSLIMSLFSTFFGGKAKNGNVTFCVWPDLWRHRWHRGQFFQLHLKDLVQYSLLKFEFFRHFYWLPREMGGGGGALRPPAEGRGRTRPSRARSMGSLYNLSYFVKSWYFPLKVVAKQTNKSVLFSHWLKNAAEILLHSDQNLREYPNHSRASARWLSDWAQTTSTYFYLPL